MKLIVQIPCFNEADTLPATVRDIPRQIEGIDQVEILIIDDGSVDGTAQIARDLGVDHIIRHRSNKGLARTFRTGISACLRLGADIIVNTDGDNQYCGQDIPGLIKPIIDGRAEIVVGDRQTATIAHFSRLKKLLQTVGSAVMRRLSGTQVPDAVSGFRAISREAAMLINIVSPFSYTLEMLMQARSKRLAVASVPVRTNPKTRDSRLARSIFTFLRRSGATIVRTYTMYQPLRVFCMIGGALAILGALPILRFIYVYMIGDGTGHIQSLVVGGVLVVVGLVTALIGLLADLISFNRQLIELTLHKVTAMELRLETVGEGSPPPSATSAPVQPSFDVDAVRRELTGRR